MKRPPTNNPIGTDVLGNYRIVARLAKGGMGEIFLAVHAGAAGFARPVVIKKILPSRLGDDLAVEMFAREARIMSKLRHPGIVGVHDFGRDEGAYFMVLEYVHGYNLSQWSHYSYHHATDRPFPMGPALSIILRILDALDYAHNATGMDGKPLDVVHRDIKPSNIMVSTEGRVLLADFGIARAQTESTTISTSGSLIKGTYSYVAPEIFDGVQPSPGTDVYACAVVLYYLLTGRNPFSARTPRATVRMVLDHVPEPLATLRDDIPAELSAAVARELDKAPDQRFPDAASFARALRAIPGFDMEAADAELALLAGREFRSQEFASRIRVIRLTDLERAIEGHPLPGDSTVPTGESAATMTASGEITQTPTTSSGLAYEELIAIRQFTPEPSAEDADLLPVAVAPQRAASRRGRLWLIAGMLVCLAAAGAAVALTLSRGSESPEPVVIVQVPTVPVDEVHDAAPIDAGPVTEESPAAPDAAVPVPGPGKTDRPRNKPAQPSTGRKLSQVFSKKNSKIRECFKKHTVNIDGAPALMVEFVTDANGRVESAKVLPPSVASQPVGNCIKRVAESIRFGRQGKRRSFRIPVKIRQTSQ